jgi:hypothetical protein
MNFSERVLEYEYRLTRPQVTSTIFSLETPFKTLEPTFHNGVSELLGYLTGGKKPIVRLSKNYKIGEGKFGQVQRWDFHVNDPRAYVSLSQKGRLQVNTTETPEAVLRFLDRTYFPGVLGLPFKIVKIDTKLNIDRTLRLENLESEIFTKVPKSKYQTVRYEPELMPGLYLKWASPAVNFIIYVNGTILTQGLKSREDVGITAQVLKSLFSDFGVDRLKVFKYMRGGNYMGLAEPPVPQGKNKEGKRAHMLDARYPPAQSYTDERQGFYVRPGPDLKPRFYPVVGDLALVRAKVIRAYANAGVAVPSPVRTLLSIAAGQTPKAKAEIRRASGWNAEKNGYYIKPGPGGQPYFYKVPKHKAGARPTVIAAYQKAGRRIPSPVRTLFGITKTPDVEHSVKNRILNTNSKGHLRINGKHFDRFTKAELLRLARDLSIPNVNNSNTLNKIASRILNVKGRTRNRVDMRINGVPIVLQMNGRVKRGDRARQWTTLNVQEKNAIARAYLTEPEYAEWTGMPSADKYDALLAVKTGRVPVQPKTPSPAASSAASSAGNFNLDLEATLRVNEVGGSKNDEQKLRNIFRNLPRGARGKPLKADIDRAAREFTRILKMKKQLENARAAYKAKIVVPNWLPANKKNDFAKMLLNLATAPNTKGRFPTQAAVRRGVSGWIRTQLPRQPLAARNVENLATGLVRRVPAWNPNVIKTPNVPNLGLKRLGTPRKPRAAAAPPTGPKKDPRENKVYALPKTENVENLANSISRLGLGIGPSNKYSWTYLKNKGLSNKYKNVWFEHVAGGNAHALNSFKTAKARAEWLALRKPLVNKQTYKALQEQKKALNQKNKNRRAAARAAATS